MRTNELVPSLFPGKDNFRDLTLNAIHEVVWLRLGEAEKRVYIQETNTKIPRQNHVRVAYRVCARENP